MGQRTPLYDAHLAAGARMVDFGGWDMPIHYGSQIEEHHAVRQHSGVFDVSHMTVIDLSGPDAQRYLRYVLANDVARLKTPGKALYSAMLNEQGGVIDDLIVYWLGDAQYRLVVNCATREKDLAWLNRQAEALDVALRERDDLAMLAVQGPEARAQVAAIAKEAAPLIESLPVFQGQASGNRFYARTGYTGEDGLEILLPGDEAPAFWQQLLDAGVVPCGLGARDTLRLEAGMNLYGNDMDETVSPLEANMGWTVSLDDSRDFIGKAALLRQQQEGHRELKGLVMTTRGVLRAHQVVKVPGKGEGEITSGTFSPTLGYSIAMARLPQGSEGEVEVMIRHKAMPARIVSLPFVRHGKPVFDQ